MDKDEASMIVTNLFREVRARTDEVWILKGKADKNTGFVTFDLANEVIIPLFGEHGVMWRNYTLHRVNLFSFNFIVRSSSVWRQGTKCKLLNSTSLSVILYKI